MSGDERMFLRDRPVSRLLDGVNTIALVGCSSRPHRTSHRTLQYLLQEGFDVVPVNPNHQSILGLTCYPSLIDVPPECRIDLVDVFRRPRFVEDIVRDVIRRRETTGQGPVIWTQIGVSSQSAEALARAHRIPYVANRCLMVEHGRHS